MSQSSTAGDSAAPFAGTGIVPRPELFESLMSAARVTLVSAPAGSGKTSLLRSWVIQAGVADDAAWVSVEPEERDPQRFWLALLEALRHTTAGSGLVRAVSAAPGLDLWRLVEHLLEDVGSLERPLWLVIDDLHELRSGEALAQLELLLMRAPAELRFVLIARHDPRLRLHRLRLEGGLSEVRAEELRFTLDESRALLEAAGVQLSDSALALLHERTEGWAAGLRLAALSLAGHPDPDWFAVEFSGSERTVAEYLFAEVLERQTDEVRRLLLRTSVLERVSGPLADRLTGGSGGERILQELEEANAFVVALDPRRSWFRYHNLFADLLALELRRVSSAELPALHDAAAEWFAENGYPLEAIRQARAAGNLSLAARMLSDHSLGFHLNGQGAIAHELLTSFPAGLIGADPELAALKASDELLHGTLEEAERYYSLAVRRSGSVPADRRGPLQILLAQVRLYLARHRGDVSAVMEEAQRLLALLETPDSAQPGVAEDVRALVQFSLGSAELWAFRIGDAERHIGDGVALARRIARPWLEIFGLGNWAQAASFRSIALTVQRAVQAVELARQHGWSEEPMVGLAYAALAGAMLWQGRLEEAEPWLEHAERVVPQNRSPLRVQLHCLRGLLELARGRHQRALEALEAAEGLGERLVTPGRLTTQARALRLYALMRLGDIETVERGLAELGERQRGTGEMHIVLAGLQLARDDPEAASDVLAAVTIGSAPLASPGSMIEALLLEAIARDELGDARAAEHALERALDLAEPDGMLLPFLMHPAPGLLERHSGHYTTHASLIAQIFTVQSGARPASPVAEPGRLREPLSESELRVLRYLPTNLSRPEIASELYLSVHTIKTHIQHLYAKLDAHDRSEAVERARALGLLAPSSRKR